jgi:membrane-associated protein
MPDLLAFPGPVACLVVLGLLVVESGLLVGVFLPGDSLLFGAGLLVGAGRIDVPIAVLAASAWLGAVLGDGLGYAIGRGFGRPWGNRGWSRRFVGAAERMYARHGWFAVVICRWFPGVRAVVPTLAGIGRMHPLAFALANATGALLWAVGMVLLGYAAAAVPQVRDVALWAMAVSIALTVAYGIAAVVRRRQAKTALT